MAQRSSPRILQRIGSVLRRYAIAGIWVYFTLLLLWFLGYVVTGDRYPIFVFLNAAAVYYFLPLPIVVLAAILTRRREMWIGAGIGVILFAFLWGGLFLPRGRAAGEDEPTLMVMTYNALGYNQAVGASVAMIEQVDADVVVLQEVNGLLAQALGNTLGDAYPWQVLDPTDDVRGMGVISKLPLHPTGENLPLEWVGTPQIVEVEWTGKRITLVNFHMWALGLGPLRYIEMNTRAREAQALCLVEFSLAAAQKGPVILAGDANATPQSDVYRMLAGWLKDSWPEAGYGLGHTFPGSRESGGAGPSYYGIPLPQGLFRIDYVFHSVDLKAIKAFVAPYDGFSDHRAVAVVLAASE
jgi:endonuclease/exonuclease/phosphatase (EEP) superfamily protein YafD